MSGRPAKEGSFKGAWQHRPWRRFLASTALSATGDFLYTVALVVYLIEKTGSAGWVAAAMIARIAASTALGALGGVVADRVDRRRLMVSLDGARAAVMVIVAVVVMADGAAALVVALVVLTAALSTPYRPAAVAVTPLLVAEDDLAAANAAEASVGQLAWFAGPAIGAAIVAVSGPEVAFFVNGATFVASAVLVAGLRSAGRAERAGGDAVDAGSGPSVVQQLAEGGRTIVAIPGLLAMTLLLSAVLFAWGVESVVQVLVAEDRLDLGADGVGILNASIGAGGVIAVPFAARLANRRGAGRLLAVSGLLMGLPLALLAVTRDPTVAGGLMVLEGVGNIMFDVLFITMLQRACPEQLLGRVYSLQDSSGALTQLAGTICAPVLVATVSLEAALVVGGGTLMVLALLLTPALAAISKRTESERLRLAPIAARLGRLGILGDASQAARERIARSSTRVIVPAGTAVVTEGDPAVDLYVIESGTALVTTAALGEIRTLGPDDWFGEIGLLHELPRTATITATDELALLVIPGKVFLDAVAGSPVLPRALANTVGVRLARTHPHLAAGAG